MRLAFGLARSLARRSRALIPSPALALVLALALALAVVIAAPPARAQVAVQPRDRQFVTVIDNSYGSGAGFDVTFPTSTCDYGVFITVNSGTASSASTVWNLVRDDGTSVNMSTIGAVAAGTVNVYTPGSQYLGARTRVVNAGAANATLRITFYCIRSAR